MKKFIALATSAVVLATSIVGCGSTAEEANNVSTTEAVVEVADSASTTEAVKEEVEATITDAAEAESGVITITDDAGVTMEIPSEINRIVLGDVYPMASVLTVYLGSAEKVVGIHPVSMSAAENGILGELYPELLNAETSFVNDGQINIEELIKLDPDIVIGINKDTAEELRSNGIPAVTIIPSKYDYDIVETYEKWVELLDDIFGGSEIAARVESYSDKALQEVTDIVSTIPEEEKKNVMVMFNYDDTTLTVSGQQFFGQYWTDVANANNVAADIDTPGSIAVDMEQVYEWDPEVILITNFTSAQPEDLYNNAIGSDDWSVVTAVANEDVYKMPLGLYRTFTPGADTPVTLWWVAKTIYPEYFEDYDINEITKEYFEECYGVELTDEQINEMYNPSRDAAKGL